MSQPPFTINKDTTPIMYPRLPDQDSRLRDPGPRERRGLIPATGALLAGVLLLLSACDRGSPILLGFSGTLTGTYADLGVQGRNGATLAVEDLNARGGVKGRELRLLVEDDLGTPAGAAAADARLYAQGVVAIIGHMTSGLTAAALPEAERARRVLFSPSSSSPAFTGKKDALFRCVTTSEDEAAALAGHIRTRRGVRRAHIVLDKDNAAYSEAFAASFARSFEEKGGRVISLQAFSSRAQPDFDAIASRIDGGEETCLFIVASSRDTAAMVQAAKNRGLRSLMAGSGWARTGDLPKYGGKTVDGMLFGGPFDKDSQDVDFTTFRAAFARRFGSEPNFAAAYAYEAVLFLAEALGKADGDPQRLFDTLPGLEIKGLAGRITLDDYGDVNRPAYIEEVHNQEFRIIEVVDR